LTDEQIAAMRNPALIGTVKLPTIEDAVKAGGFLAGQPDDIIEQLKAVEKRYPGLDRVICATPSALRSKFSSPTRPLRKGRNPGLPRHPHRRPSTIGGTRFPLGPGMIEQLLAARGRLGAVLLSTHDQISNIFSPPRPCHCRGHRDCRSQRFHIWIEIYHMGQESRCAFSVA
jgi:hypothetical protein